MLRPTSRPTETGSGLLLEIRAQGYLPRDASVRRHSHIHISALLFPAVDIPTNPQPGPTRRSSHRARSPLAAQRHTDHARPPRPPATPARCSCKNGVRLINLIHYSTRPARHEIRLHSLHADRWFVARRRWIDTLGRVSCRAREAAVSFDLGPAGIFLGGRRYRRDDRKYSNLRGFSLIADRQPAHEPQLRAARLPARKEVR